MRQTEVKAGITTDELEQYVQLEKSQLTAENEQEYQQLQSQLIAVKADLSAYQAKEFDIAAVKEELTALYPEVSELSAGYMRTPQNPAAPASEAGEKTISAPDVPKQPEYQEQVMVVLEVSELLEKADMEKITNWLEKRLETEQIVLYQSVDGVLYSADYEVPKTEETSTDTEENTEEDVREEKDAS